MSRLEDKRAFFKLDVGYLSNPKMAELMDDHPRAILLHLQCIAYSAQHLTDGIVPMRLAMRIACATQSDLDACLSAGVLRMRNGTHVEVHDYLLHQRSAESVKGLSEQAKRAAKARWDAEKQDAERMQTAMPREKRERELPCAPAGAADATDDRFEEFWDTYDKKVDRKRAEGKWRIALKKRGVNADLLINAAAKYVARQRSIGKHPEFTKKPDTWLNGENWTDETSNVTPIGGVNQQGLVLPPLPPRSPFGGA